MLFRSFQRAFWVGTTNDPAYVERTHIPSNLTLHALLAVVVSLVFLGIGQLIFSRLQDRIPERLS